MPKSPTPTWLRAYAPIGEAIARLFHPYAEVVVHDLASDRIVALWNPTSRRRVGDPALISELPEGLDTLGGPLGIYGPYAKVLPDGRSLTSVSAVLLDAQGIRRGMMCVNFDRSPLDGVVQLLSGFAAALAPQPPELFQRDWREQIAQVIAEECRARHLRLGELTRADRTDLVRTLKDKGLFSTRQAASHTAAALGVSRATVYSLLKEVSR
jgi:predicted transcriptional regulator YheO